MNKDLVLLNTPRQGKKVIKLYADPYDEDWLKVEATLKKLGFTFRTPDR